jgi:hypothetical protein
MGSPDKHVNNYETDNIAASYLGGSGFTSQSPDIPPFDATH